MTSSQDTMAVVPGRSLGLFSLGDSLWHVLDLLRTHKGLYPKVEVEWDVDNPQTTPVTIHLPFLSLHFPPTPPPSQQLLQLITVPSLEDSRKYLTITYKTHTLSSQDQNLTKGVIGSILGPTFQSPQNEQDDSTSLVYPGVGFTLSSNSTPTTSDRDQPIRSLSLFPFSSEILQQAGSSKRKTDWEIMHQSVKSVVDMIVTPSMDVTISSCDIDPHKGITLQFHSSSSSVIPNLEVLLRETTAQDLLLDLGPPLRKFWKEDDRIGDVWNGGVHDGLGSTGTGGVENGLNGSIKGRGCWWNYFQHGLDFLVDDEGDGTVMKIMVHSNIPGSALFQRYARCPWTISTSSSSPPLTFANQLSEFATHISAKAARRRHNQPGSEDDFVNPVENDQGGGAGRAGSDGSYQAMSLDRVGEGGLDGVVGIEPSKLVALDGLVLEEAHGGGISSVLLF